jgi:flagellar assembly factor FliW
MSQRKTTTQLRSQREYQENAEELSFRVLSVTEESRNVTGNYLAPTVFRETRRRLAGTKLAHRRPKNTGGN